MERDKMERKGKWDHHRGSGGMPLLSKAFCVISNCRKHGKCFTQSKNKLIIKINQDTGRYSKPNTNSNILQMPHCN